MAHGQNTAPFKQKAIKSRTIVPSNPNSSGQPQSSELKQVGQLLHLLFHRNKNQHHTQKWWKWLSILRRSIIKLLNYEGKGWRRREEERQKAALESRVKDIVLPGAWVAFSTLVADNQFCALGLVLVAVLARMGKIMGLPSAISGPFDTETEVESQPVSGTDETRRRTKHMLGSGNGEDIGKLVERSANRGELMPTCKESLSDKRSAEDFMDQSDIGVGGQDVLERKLVEKPDLQSRPKKKRKNRNSIDELFGDLI